MCVHVTCLHALCGDKLPPFGVPAGRSHWLGAGGVRPSAQGRGGGGGSLCLCAVTWAPLGTGTVLSSQEVWQPHHGPHLPVGDRVSWSGLHLPSWSRASQGHPRRRPVSLLLPSGCLRFCFLSHCGWQGLEGANPSLGCWGLMITPSPVVLPLL